MNGPLSTLCAVLLGVGVAGVATAQVSLSDLHLKGTHNSYACNTAGNNNGCPVVHNPYWEQIDDWNVWSLELDFGVKNRSGPRLIIGHDGYCDNGCWTTHAWATMPGCNSPELNDDDTTLRDVFRQIRCTQAFQYRPIVLLLERKEWGDSQYESVGVWAQLLADALVEEFGESGVFGPADLGSAPWPSVPELAGQVIPVVFGHGHNEDLLEDAYDSTHVSAFVRNHLFTVTHDGEELTYVRGPGVRTSLARIGDASNITNYEQFCAWAKDGIQIISTDVYQINGTFSPCHEPPNPVVISASAAITTHVVNDYGNSDPCCDDLYLDPASCGGTGFYVDEHGTARFPYRTVGSGLDALDPTANAGWTLVIRAGSYGEGISPSTPLVINQHVVLESGGGLVTIGQ